VAAAPRLALPFSTALGLVLGVATSALTGWTRLAQIVIVPIAIRAASLSRTHATPPAAVLMLRAIAHDPALARAGVVGGRSSRFAPWGEGARIAPGELAGDAVIWATRADPFPDPLLVTSELDLRGVPASRLQPLASFSRPSPLDRRERAITVYRLFLTPP
jgi:hypothetical protein